MITQELVEFIKLQFQEGNNQVEIKNMLLGNGWAETDINEAFTLTNPVPPTTLPPPLPDANQQTTVDNSILIPRNLQQSPSRVDDKFTQNSYPVHKYQKIYDDLGETNIVINGKGESIKSLPWGLFAILFIIVILGGSFYYYLNRQKSELEILIKKQQDNFSSLESTYSNIISSFKVNPSTKIESNQGTNLLGASSDNELPRAYARGIPARVRRGGASSFSSAISPPYQAGYSRTENNILGLEENPTIVALRKLGDLYRQGQKQNEDISSLSNQAENKIQMMPIKFFLPKQENLLSKTKNLTDYNRQLFNYLEKENDIDLKSLTPFVETNAALDNIQIKGINEASLSQLKEKINSLDALQKQYIALDTSSLPAELRQKHQRDLESIPIIKVVFQNVYNALKSGDPQIAASTIKNFKALMFELILGSELSRANIISFWQNKQLDSTQEIKNEWGKYYQQISSYTVLQSVQEIISP